MKTFQTSMAEDAFTPPLIPEWIEVSNVLWPKLQAAIVGDMTAQEALDAAPGRCRRDHAGRRLQLILRRRGGGSAFRATTSASKAARMIRGPDHATDRIGAACCCCCRRSLTMLFVVALPLIFSLWTSLTPYKLTKPERRCTISSG